MFTVELTDPAKIDIRQNAEWWATNRSSDQAEQWYIAIIQAIQSLEQMPLRCGLAPESNKFDFDLRQLLFGLSSRLTHRILFGVEDETVTIFRVLHTSQTTIDNADELG